MALKFRKNILSPKKDMLPLNCTCFMEDFFQKFKEEYRAVN